MPRAKSPRRKARHRLPVSKPNPRLLRRRRKSRNPLSPSTLSSPSSKKPRASSPGPLPISPTLSNSPAPKPPKCSLSYARRATSKPKAESPTSGSPLPPAKPSPAPNCPDLILKKYGRRLPHFSKPLRRTTRTKTLNTKLLAPSLLAIFSGRQPAMSAKFRPPTSASNSRPAPHPNPPPHALPTPPHPPLPKLPNKPPPSAPSFIPSAPNPPSSICTPTPPGCPPAPTSICFHNSVFGFGFEVSAGAPYASARPLGARVRHAWGFTRKFRSPHPRHIYFFSPSQGSYVPTCHICPSGSVHENAFPP